jgi:arginine deiminase
MEGYNTYMIGVASEIGILQKVLLHRPGSEFERLTPKYLEEMLFEDIPYLKKIREEHDKFAETLCSLGCEVYYYQDLLMEVLRTEEFRDGNSRSRP